MTAVLIKSGYYKLGGEVIDVVDETFPTISEYVDRGATGSITVNGYAVESMPNRNVRITVRSIEDIKMLGPDGLIGESESIEPSGPSGATCDTIRKEEIAERFDILSEMTRSTVNGNIRSMIVSGPPGVGKSFGILEELERMNMFSDVAGEDAKFQVVKGAMTALGLYCQLHQYKEKGNVLVFDDCDTVLQDELSLNILKAALDSGKRRRIFWNSDSRKLSDEGIPNYFDFAGSVIFVTNIKFDHIRSKKLRDHLDALESRSHYLDLTLDTERDKFLRIEQIAATGELFSKHRLNEEESAEILEFMYTNRARLREISLRMAVKIADLYKTSPRWARVASMTCMR